MVHLSHFAMTFVARSKAVNDFSFKFPFSFEYLIIFTHWSRRWNFLGERARELAQKCHLWNSYRGVRLTVIIMMIRCISSSTRCRHVTGSSGAGQYVQGKTNTVDDSSSVISFECISDGYRPLLISSLYVSILLFGALSKPRKSI